MPLKQNAGLPDPRIDMNYFLLGQDNIFLGFVRLYMSARYSLAQVRSP
jgi:hypothetical protein